MLATLAFSVAIASPLCDAVQQQRPDVEAVRAALAAGADPDLPCRTWKNRDQSGAQLIAALVPVVGWLALAGGGALRPMNIAIDTGHNELFDVLLPSTPMAKHLYLSQAVGRDRTEMAISLLAAGANPHIGTLDGRAAKDVDALATWVDLGVRLDNVSYCPASGVSAEWVTFALTHGLPARSIIVPATGRPEVFQAALAAAPHDSSLLVERAVKNRRWDLYDLAVAAGATLPPNAELLTIAAGQGDLKGIERLLALQPTVDLKEAVMVAIYRERADVVVRLVTHAGTHTPWGSQALSTALRSKQVDSAKVLLQHGIPIDDSAVDAGATWLPSAQLLLKQGLSEEQTRRLLAGAIKAKRADVYVQVAKRVDRDDPSVCQAAVVAAVSVHSHPEVWVERLAASGFNLGACANPEAVWRRRRIDPAAQTALLDHGFPPGHALLHAATEARDHAQVMSLLDQGVRPIADDILILNGSRPEDLGLLDVLLPHVAAEGLYEALTQAIRKRQEPIVSRLIAQGVDPNQPNRYQQTALIEAIRRSTDDTLWLLGLGFDPNAPDLDGDIPLSHAVSRRDPSIVQALLDAGADASGCTTVASTCTKVAWTIAGPALALRLIDAGAPAQAGGLLDLAVRSDDGATIGALIERGAAPTHAFVGWLAAGCELDLARETRIQWPEALRRTVQKKASQAGCGGEFKAILRGP